MHRVAAYFLILFLLLSCHSNDSSIESYHKIGAELNKNHRVSGSDLIITYDLGRIDNTDCIYAKDLGLIINSKKYQSQYLDKFGKNYKSPDILRTEARLKVARIQKLLLKIHKRYKILTAGQYRYVSKLAKLDIKKIDARKELVRLDKIIRFIPLMLPEYKVSISSHYGRRKHPVKGVRKFHCGIDLYSKVSAPIFAAASGRVAFAGRMNGYGNMIEVLHPNGMKTRYAHLRSLYVRKDQMIHRGQIIGRQGKSGKVTNEHLHFEIWIRGKHINPYELISHACKCQK